MLNKKSFLDAVTITNGAWASLDKASPNKASLCEASGIIAAYKARACPECLKHGYHSPLHQIIALDHCFIHTDQEIVSLNNSFGSKESYYYQVVTRSVELMKNETLKAQIEKTGVKVLAELPIDPELAKKAVKTCPWLIRQALPSLAWKSGKTWINLMN